MGIKGKISKAFPQLNMLAFHVNAIRDVLSFEKKSYSQNREDVDIIGQLTDQEIKNQHYIDVGANQPSLLSNTYKLYRRGGKGILIEPNVSLYSILKKYRSRDDIILAGCDLENGIKKFNYSKSNVLSSFDSKVQDLYKSEFIPVLRLDSIIKAKNVKAINLLSIDTEGFDFMVLKSLGNFIGKVKLICIEAGENIEVQKHLMSNGFEVIKKYKCNVLYKNLKR